MSTDSNICHTSVTNRSEYCKPQQHNVCTCEPTLNRFNFSLLDWHNAVASCTHDNDVQVGLPATHLCTCTEVSVLASVLFISTSPLPQLTDRMPYNPSVSSAVSPVTPAVTSDSADVLGVSWTLLGGLGHRLGLAKTVFAISLFFTSSAFKSRKPPNCFLPPGKREPHPIGDSLHSFCPHALVLRRLLGGLGLRLANIVMTVHHGWFTTPPLNGSR